MLYIEVANEIMRCIGFVDECLSLFLEAIIAKNGIMGMQPDVETMTKSSWPTEATMVEASDALQRLVVDEEPLQQFTSKLVAFLKGLPPRVKSAVDVGSYVQSLQVGVVVVVVVGSSICKSSSIGAGHSSRDRRRGRGVWLVIVAWR